MNPKIAEVAFNLKKNEVSDIILSDTGIHIIKVLNKRNGRKVPYSEAKRFIRQGLLIERAKRQLVNMIKVKKKISNIEIFL